MSTHKQNIEELVEILSKLSVLDMSKLKTALEETWGVKAAAAAPMMMMNAGAGAAPAATEQKESTEYKVTLQEVPADKKIGVIKVIREIMNLGLKEAKDLVEAAPKVLKETTTKADAESIAKKVADAGGKVVLAGL